MKARTLSDEELQLKRRARRRLIGAIVLVTAIVVVLPMVLDSEPRPISHEVSIQIPSPDAGPFTSRVTPLTPAPGSKPAAKPPAVEEKIATASPAPKAEPPKPARKTRPRQPPRKPANPASEPFVVQVIALADAEKAKQLQSKIAAAGIKSYTEVVRTAKGDVTRVRAGPYATREAAEQAREQLTTLGLNGNITAR